jgi:V/A-type H+-transporting ATPase subunit F
MYKIAVIGSPDTVMGFKALGLETFSVSGAEDAQRVVRRLTNPDAEDRYAIIYVEENLAGGLSAEIARFKHSVTPAVILIPGRDGSTGQGMSALHDAVKRAVGADII